MMNLACLSPFVLSIRLPDEFVVANTPYGGLASIDGFAPRGRDGHARPIMLEPEYCLYRRDRYRAGVNHAAHCSVMGGGG
jgi:hypothetical protein